LVAQRFTPHHGSVDRRTTVRAGFTLLDVLVVIAVIAILLSLLAPSLSRVTESARRVVCGSNLHQAGLGLSMWVNDHNGYLPPVEFADQDLDTEPARLLQLAHLGEREQQFDGLGLLVANGYLTAPSLFYCPSHRGENAFDRYEKAWDEPGDEIVVNYHYRWLSAGNRFLDNLHDDVTLVSDGFRTLPDYNHGAGANMLKADMRVVWFKDTEGRFADLLPTSLDDERADDVRAGALMAALDVGRVPEGEADIDKNTGLLNGGVAHE
jgi:prepilin-type N-terminal cleavage/methylation domain-containing protein